MDYSDFVPRKEAYDKFIEYRKEVYEAADGRGRKGSFQRVFTELSTKAYAGDPVAQDVVAYFYNKGIENLLPENFDLYMSWEILAAANGNEFAIKKLEFFLTYGLDQIIFNEEIVDKAIANGSFDRENYLYIIGNLLCEGIVDVVGIDPKKLIDKQNDLNANSSSKYSMEQNRVYSRAMEMSLPRVIEYLTT